MLCKHCDMDLSDKSVLLVDDNKAVQNLCGIYLNKLGVEDLDVAENGNEAVEMVRKKLYDLIIMDIVMPVMDGEQAAEEIRKLDNGSYPKIMAYTANREFEKGNAFDLKILKPVSIIDMRDAILQVLNTNKKVESDF